MSQNFLKCNLHDYLEIACLYKFEVELILTNETRLLGIPITTQTIKKVEYLEFKSSDKLLSILVLDLVSMRACTPNPYFDLLKFT